MLLTQSLLLFSLPAVLSLPVLDIPMVAGPVVAQSVPCDATPKRRSDGTIESCRLATAYRLGSIELPISTEVTFFKSGVVNGAKLGGPTAVDGEPLPDGATLYFTSAGLPYDFFLERNGLYKGHHLVAISLGVHGVGHILRTDGKLKAIRLSEEETIDGIPCASTLPIFRGWWHGIRIGAQSQVWFYEDGRLQQAMLARDVTIQGHKFKAGDVVMLNRDGTLDLTSPKLDWKGPRYSNPELNPMIR